MWLTRDAFGVWSKIAKRAFKAVFSRPSNPAERVKETIREREVAVYIHYPFCKSYCNFCPYARVLWDKKLESRYLNALKEEIAMYGKLLDELDIKVIDVHIGGGTPSLMNPKDLSDILEVLGENFDLSFDGLAIEANPNDINEQKAAEMIDSGVKEVSLGVQSFNSTDLKRLGRPHTVEDSLEAIRSLDSQGLEHLNIDLMYAIPGQSLADWENTLRIASEQEVDEVTCYPTLITPQCPAYSRVVRGDIPPQPDKRTFKRMILSTYQILEAEGFRSVEIYGFSKEDAWKYATVNYEMEGPLLAFGSGAVGFTGGYEYVNTHSPREYVKSLKEGVLPIAGAREVSPEERAIRYVVCRLFVEGELSLRDFERKFGGEFDNLLRKTGFSKALFLLRLLGIVKKKADSLELNKAKIVHAHMLCWAFVANVPCRIAEEFMKTPWPPEVIIP